ECDLRKSPDVKKFRAAQMIVALTDTGIDTLHADSYCDRRFFRMLPVDVDPAVELCELAMCRSQVLVDGERDGRAGWIEFVDVVRERGRVERHEETDARA